MNNVYDLAHDLARSLKETDQYKNYVKIKARIDAEPDLAKMVNDFQQKNMEVQTHMMLNDGKAPEEMMQQLRDQRTHLIECVAEVDEEGGFFGFDVGEEMGNHIEELLEARSGAADGEEDADGFAVKRAVFPGLVILLEVDEEFVVDEAADHLQIAFG